ncbi:hypothetical protein AVEN_42708-1 [Araneus ventricosus]|uniref:Uncharacterized protein n=1 Tax=Araneus ventricosus TaxID=182803 RepID=A0A4Y2BMH6_ARAVE|nr:hypothetical protein AVEN_42708-1 [Araneus ventricosus]
MVACPNHPLFSRETEKTLLHSTSSMEKTFERVPAQPLDRFRQFLFYAKAYDPYIHRQWSPPNLHPSFLRENATSLHILYWEKPRLCSQSQQIRGPISPIHLASLQASNQSECPTFIA